MQSYYGNLCTEFYDLTKPWALPDEVAFYQQLLDKNKGPILEAMCGTGRLLLPLIQAGFNVEGVDNSHAMLAKCHDKAKMLNLNPIFYDKDIAEMQLNKKYQAIIIALGSFQLIHPRETATRVLENLKTHLAPGGKLLIDTFIPWDALCKEEDSSIKEAIAEDGSMIKITIHEKSNKLEQYIDSTLLYEKIKKDHVIQNETELMRVCWYYKYELEMLLQLSGFNFITLHDVPFEMNAHGILYEAVV